MMVICPSCGGEKVDYMSVISDECEECAGVGELDCIPCHYCHGVGCPTCGDSGELHDIPCPLCDGFGEVEHHPKCLDCNGTGWRPNPIFDSVN